jgi:hypothetical protein
MPVDPSPLPWWEWLLWGLGGGIGAMIASGIVNKTKDGAWAMAWWVTAIIAGAGGVISFVIGLVRFAQWAWK